MSDPVSEDLLRVGHYELSSTLGKGNFSLVRLGVHVLTGVEVAVKIVAKSKLDAESASKMRREIQILRSLSSHPHIIRLFQVMESPSGIYMVTEHAQKGEIFDYIAENGRLPEDKAAKWFAQILSAVGHLHGLGIVHRDLKAENLLLDEHQNVKLADFGFSNFYSSGVLLSTWCGSPPYAAPELFEGKAYVGPKADIWSLGVVLYVLVSGSLPFDAPTLHELKARVLSCQYRVPFFLSSHCEDLLKGLLVSEPEKRLTLSQIRAQPWMRLRNKEEEDPGTKRGRTPFSTEVCQAVAQALHVSSRDVQEAVQQKKCDDISATYHLTEMSLSHSCSALEAPEDGALQEVYSEAAPLKAITSKIKFNSILPQTDLSLNLPLVGDQPLENFTVKNPHLLRPPDGLDSYFAHQGRRASDGGAYLIPPPPSSLQKEQEEASSSLAVPLLQPTSLRRRRSGGLQPVAEKSPDNPFSEVENRILDSGSWLSVGSLEAANYPPSTLRQRRTGLSTVMEGGKNASGLKDSLCLPYERFSPVRRSTESSSSSSTSPCSTGGGFHHRSTTPDPADIRALQEEYHSLQLNVGKTHHHHTHPHHSNKSSTLDIPRRSSDGSVVSPKLSLKIPTSRSSGASEPLKLMYDDMYTAVDASLSRRFSYPNSPIHFGSGSTSPRAGGSPLPGTSPKPLHSPNTLKRQSITRDFQGLSLSKTPETVLNGGGEPKKFFKGSITQGLPSRKVTTGKKKAEGGVGERTPHLIQPKICVTDSSGIKVTPIFHEQQILLHTPMEEGGP